MYRPAAISTGGATRPPVIHASTAMFPGFTVRAALDEIVAGVVEPLYGRASTAHVQLCPQNLGQLDERTCEALAADYPDTQMRLHANARVEARHRLLDASTFGAETHAYYAALADRSRRLKAPAYSLHAGFVDNCDLGTMIDNVRRLQDLFGPGCVVAVEGLYPNAHRPQLMDTWQAYEQVMRAGLPVAIDLSHLNIVARRQRTRDTGLVRELLSGPQTVEIHVSANDGGRDAHDVLTDAPWWWSCLQAAGPNAVVFSEGNQVREAARAIGRLSTSARPRIPLASAA